LTFIHLPRELSTNIYGLGYNGLTSKGSYVLEKYSRKFLSNYMHVRVPRLNTQLGCQGGSILALMKCAKSRVVHTGNKKKKKKKSFYFI